MRSAAETLLVYFVAALVCLSDRAPRYRKERQCIETCCAPRRDRAERVRDVVDKSKEALQREKRLQKEVVDLLADDSANAGRVVAAPKRDADAMDMNEIGKIRAGATLTKGGRHAAVQTFGSKADGAFLISSASSEARSTRPGPILWPRSTAERGGKGGRAAAASCREQAWRRAIADAAEGARGPRAGAEI